MEQNRNEGLLNFLTIASGIAILCVVLLHSHQRYLTFLFAPNVPIYMQLPFVDSVYEHLVVFSVALSILISGFKYESTRKIENVHVDFCN